MIYLKEESLSNYEDYQFRYTLWGIPESEKDFEVLYGQGYLPYSDLERKLPVFYFCRSLRVPLDAFELSSENRRVLRRVNDAGIVPEKKALTRFEAVANESLIQFFLDYFAEHHGDSVMSRSRLLGILNYDNGLHVDVYAHEGLVIGAIVVIEIGEVHHYWFAAYSNKYPALSLGMWLMLTFIEETKRAGKSGYVYLGTGYNQKALYKTNIGQVEYFDGNGWRNDLVRLKLLMKG